MVSLLLLLLLLPASPQVQTATLKISGEVSTPADADRVRTGGDAADESDGVGAQSDRHV